MVISAADRGNSTPHLSQKEVYLSLLVGILTGSLLFTQFHVLTAVETTVEIMGMKIGDNVNILIFLVLLGILVALITKSGASKAYGEWATARIKGERGAPSCNYGSRDAYLCG